MSKIVRERDLIDSSGEEEPRPVRARLEGTWTNPKREKSPSTSLKRIPRAKRPMTKRFLLQMMMFLKMLRHPVTMMKKHLHLRKRPSPSTKKLLLRKGPSTRLLLLRKSPSPMKRTRILLRRKRLTTRKLLLRNLSQRTTLEWVRRWQRRRGQRQWGGFSFWKQRLWLWFGHWSGLVRELGRLVGYPDSRASPRGPPRNRQNQAPHQIKGMVPRDRQHGRAARQDMHSMMPSKMSERPWLKLSVDIFGPTPDGWYWFENIEDHSNWEAIDKISSPIEDQVEPVLNRLFSTFGATGPFRVR